MCTPRPRQCSPRLQPLAHACSFFFAAFASLAHAGGADAGALPETAAVLAFMLTAVLCGLRRYVRQLAPWQACDFFPDACVVL